MKKVLIITYYWPPMGGGGVQRWLKFSKYLRDYGWEPIIYTPSNADVANSDPSLSKDVSADQKVVKTKIWEPFDLYKKFIGKSKDEKIQPGFLQESDSKKRLQDFSVWVRGNFFIPDAKMFWINPSIRFLKKYVKNNQIDAVVSTGPPHSNHLIALGLKKATGIKWLADFRDPWTNIDYYDKLMLTKWADKKHHKLEAEVLKKADQVVTVSWSWADDFFKSTGRLPAVITNGYDHEDFEGAKKESVNSKLIITHIGSLNRDRNPYSLWNAISNLKLKGILNSQNFMLRFIGPTDVSAFEEIKKLELGSMFEHISNLPHKEVLQQLVNSDLLLLPLNDTPNISGVIPGKLYEYLASRRPILCIGKPEGDSAKIIKEANAGDVFDFNDEKGIEDYLSGQLNAFLSKEIPENINVPDQFSRKVLAGKIAKELDNITP